MKPLESFQLEVQSKLMSLLGTPGGRSIVTLPTGAGKTRVAVDTLRDWLTARWQAHDSDCTVLWLAHPEELSANGKVVGALRDLRELLDGGVLDVRPALETRRAAGLYAPVFARRRAHHFRITSIRVRRWM